MISYRINSIQFSAQVLLRRRFSVSDAAFVASRDAADASTSIPLAWGRRLSSTSPSLSFGFASVALFSCPSTTDDDDNDDIDDTDKIDADVNADADHPRGRFLSSSSSSS